MSKNIDEIRVLKYCPHGSLLDEDNEPWKCYRCGSESRDAQVQNLAKKLTEAQQALTEKKLVVPMSEEEIISAMVKFTSGGLLDCPPPLKYEGISIDMFYAKEMAKAIYERQFKEIV